MSLNTFHWWFIIKYLRKAKTYISFDKDLYNFHIEYFLCEVSTEWVTMDFLCKTFNAFNRTVAMWCCKIIPDDINILRDDIAAIYLFLFIVYNMI